MADENQQRGTHFGVTSQPLGTEALGPDELFSLGVATVVDPADLSDELGGEGARWSGRYAVRTAAPEALVRALEETSQLNAALVVARVPSGQTFALLCVVSGAWRFSIAAVAVGPARSWLVDVIRRGSAVILLDVVGSKQFSLLEVSCAAPGAEDLTKQLESSAEISGTENAAIVSAALTDCLTRLGAFEQGPGGGTHLRFLLPHSSKQLH